MSGSTSHGFQVGYPPSSRKPSWFLPLTFALQTCRVGKSHFLSSLTPNPTSLISIKRPGSLCHKLVHLTPNNRGR